MTTESHPATDTSLDKHELRRRYLVASRRVFELKRLEDQSECTDVECDVSYLQLIQEWCALVGKRVLVKYNGCAVCTRVLTVTYRGIVQLGSIEVDEADIGWEPVQQATCALIEILEDVNA